MAEYVDIGNFMGVLKATVQTETGVEFPGAHMPSGLPVTSTGVTKAQLMQDKDMAMQWHAAIEGQHARETKQANQEGGQEDAHQPLSGWADTDPVGRGRGSHPTAPANQGTEAQLRRRQEGIVQLIAGMESDLVALRREKLALDAYFSALDSEGA